MSEITINIAIFASGAGSNAKKIIEYFSQNIVVKVALIACSKPLAGVLNIAYQHNIPTLILEKEIFFSGDAYISALKTASIDFIVLAGFLWKVPLPLITAFPNRIVNIHPALLPKYGGKGMYGMQVHEAVVNNHETESGITIHYVDGQYDHGKIIFQAKCEVLPGENAIDVAQKILLLEHENFPKIIEKVVCNL